MNNNTLGALIIGAIIIVGAIAFMLYGNTATTPTTPAPTTTTINTTTVTAPAAGNTQLPPNFVATSPEVTTGAPVTLSNSSATITGMVTPNGSMTTYWYEYGRTSTLGSHTDILSSGSGTIAVAVPTSINNLTPSTKYYYRLSAKNALGTSVGETQTFTTPPTAPVATTVTTTAAGSVASSTATLKGHLNPNGIETTYWFEYGTDAQLNTLLGTSAKVVLAATVRSTVSVSADVKSLTPLTQYYYRLVASSKDGTAHGSILTFTTLKK